MSYIEGLLKSMISKNWMQMLPKKLPTERVKNQIPEFGVSNLPLVLPSFFRAMCTYSQIPNEAGSGGKTFGALWIFICHYYVVKKVKCDILNWMPYLSRSTLFDVPIICRNVTFYWILVEKQSHIILLSL